MKNTFIILGMMLVSAALLGGCGSDSSETPTKAEFKEQANAICSQGEKKRLAAIQRSVEEAGGSSAAEDKRIKDLIRDHIVPITLETYDEIAELEAPDADEESVQQMLVAFDDATQELGNNTAKALRENAFLQANSLAEEYGLDACAI